MKGHSNWTYHPYKPLIWDDATIAIERIVPTTSSIHLEWLDADKKEYEIYCKGEDEKFSLVGKTDKLEFDIENLQNHSEYKFFVKSGDDKSRVRLARTGEVVGTVVNYLHPDDEAYAFAGRYLMSPSFIRHPDGYLLSLMDFYGIEYPQNLSKIFRSDDEGKTWHFVSDVLPAFLPRLFTFKGEVYLFAVSTEYGDVLLGKSTDGGVTFGTPTCIARGTAGKSGKPGFQVDPQNVYIRNGRIYFPLEWGHWGYKTAFSPMVMSCDVNDDLLVAENWSFTPPKLIDRNVPELSLLPMNILTIEGSLLVDRDGDLIDVLRFAEDHKALVYKVNEKNPEAELEFKKVIPYPGNLSKFQIKYDEKSDRYYSISTICRSEVPWARSVLHLISSYDLTEWKVEKVLFDYSKEDPQTVGFQYADFIIEGDDIIFVLRTAMNNPHSQHDSNYQTFHRIKNFRTAPELE